MGAIWVRGYKRSRSVSRLQWGFQYTAVVIGARIRSWCSGERFKLIANSLFIAHLFQHFALFHIVLQRQVSCFQRDMLFIGKKILISDTIYKSAGVANSGDRRGDGSPVMAPRRGTHPSNSAKSKDWRRARRRIRSETADGGDLLRAGFDSSGTKILRR